MAIGNASSSYLNIVEYKSRNIVTLGYVPSVVI